MPGSAALYQAQPYLRGCLRPTRQPGGRRGGRTAGAVVDQALLGRDDCRVDPIARAESLENLLDVALDGVLTQVRARCDLTIRKTLGHQAQHFALARVQRLGLAGRLGGQPGRPRPNSRNTRMYSTPSCLTHTLFFLEKKKKQSIESHDTVLP